MDYEGREIDRNVTPIDRNVTPIDRNVTPIGRNVTPIGRNVTPIPHFVIRFCLNCVFNKQGRKGLLRYCDGSIAVL
jgi:hypothetical protein